jgi:hypothetical protein
VVRPRVEGAVAREELVWHPEGADHVLRLDLVDLFRRVLD